MDSLLYEMVSSSVYETPEIHGYGASYFNAVARGKTELDADSFNALLKEYEISRGRNEEARARKEVVIDIDMVVWNGEVRRPVDFSREFFRIGYEEINEPRD